MNKATLEKVFEYASKPVQGTMSRKLRKDVKIQVNEGEVYEGATLFLGKDRLRADPGRGRIAPPRPEKPDTPRRTVRRGVSCMGWR
jgi:hypothetical protein